MKREKECEGGIRNMKKENDGEGGIRTEGGMRTVKEG